MARKNDTTTEAPTASEISEKAAATRAAIGDRPRQSVVRFVQHYITIRETAPDELERLFGDQIEALEEASKSVQNPITVAQEKVAAEASARSIAALENEDEKNGYANYVFDETVFAEKTKERQPRVKRTVAEKAKDLLEGASPEDIAALQALLAERNQTL
jgi:hypothetical protein